jgi:arylsulfatase A-like enzyme
MISWPGVVKPERSKRFAHAIDLFPTIAAAAEVEVPDDLPGINLLDAEKRDARTCVFGVCNATHNMTLGQSDETLQYLWCVDGDWKLLVRYHGADTTKYANLHVWDQAPVRLYNVAEDPHEQNECSAKHPDIVARLKQEIQDWHDPEITAQGDQVSLGGDCCLPSGRQAFFMRPVGVNNIVEK